MREKKQGQKNNRKNFKGIFKGSVILLSLCVGLMLFLTKSEFFNIKNVEIIGDNLTLKESLQSIGDSFLNKNILSIKSKDVSAGLESNPYVTETKVEKVFPNKLKVNVKETDIAFYIGKGKNAYILSSDLRVLEKNINGNLNGDIKNLIEIQGVTKKKVEIGEPLLVTEDKIIENTAKDIYAIKLANKTKHKITAVDFSNLTDMKIYFGKVAVKVGDGTDVIKKINTALNILEDKKLKMERGYIDLRFDNSPVIKRG